MGITLPTIRFRTVACWVRIPDAARGACRSLGLSFAAGAQRGDARGDQRAAAVRFGQSVGRRRGVFRRAGGQVRASQAPDLRQAPGGSRGGEAGGAGVSGGFARRRGAHRELRVPRRGQRGSARERPRGRSSRGAGAGAGRSVPGIVPGTGIRGRGRVSPGSPSPLGDEDAGSGCPGCCQYASCDAYNALLDARAGLVVLRATIAAEEGREVVGVEGGYEVQCCAGEGGCRGGRTDGGFVRE